MPIGQSATACS